MGSAGVGRSDSGGANLLKMRIFSLVWGILAVLGAGFAAAMGAPTPASAAELIGVRFGAYAKSETRIVFDLTGPVEYSIAGDEQGAGRLIVEIKGLDAPNIDKAGEGHVARYSISPIGEGAAEAILSFSHTAKLKDDFLLPPKGDIAKYRLVIDIETADKAAFLASLPRRYEDLTPVLRAVTAPILAAEEVEEAEQAEDRPIIVIDAGHGGNDPGATGPDGVYEKDVTLAAATRLKQLLEAKGRYRIVMTRAGDSRIELDDRSKAAREAGADLFISLHADAHQDAHLRGGSVYTLSDKGSVRSATLARSQGDYHIFNLNISEQTPEVGGILFDLAQRETKNESARFADMLLQSLDGVIPLVNNSHRTGDLFVLLSPDVPAVLLELAFISNKKDEANLNSPAWREKAMTSVAAAIDRYFDAPKETRRAALSAIGGR